MDEFRDLVRQLSAERGKAGLLIRKHDYFKPARKMRRDVRALTARNHPEGRFYPVRRYAERAAVVTEMLVSLK